MRIQLVVSVFFALSSASAFANSEATGESTFEAPAILREGSVADHIRASKLEMEVGQAGMVSSDQREKMVESTMLKLRSMNWKNQHGADLMFNGAVYSQNQANRSMPLDAQASYRHRWISSVGQISALAGIRHHSNQNSQSFSKAYNLAMIGAGLESPLTQNFAMGAEYQYGMNSSGSYLGQLEVMARYSLRKDLGLKFGLEASGFEAKSGSESALGDEYGLPYREAKVQTNIGVAWIY